jgi:hypothetical protein
MKVEKVEWVQGGLHFIIDGVGACCDPRRDWLEHGFTTLGDMIDGEMGYWEDTLISKQFTVNGYTFYVSAPCEDPVVVAEARLYSAVMGFGDNVPGVEMKCGPRPVMSVAEAKSALRDGLWGFPKLLIP